MPTSAPASASAPAYGAEAHAPKVPRGCPWTRGKILCVGLTHQKIWIARKGRVEWGPAPVRSGRPALPTHTGWHRIERRVRDDYSRLYQVPMPYSQYFSGGQALHGVYGWVHTRPGSHGCVNLLHKDAKELWRRMRTGDPVYVWGRRPARLG
ncbi:L,D-transpeptidase [Streptomyces sp. T-3]|nr:L,D-transpeptidase [Streptomyces sp. T-3]